MTHICIIDEACTFTRFLAAVKGQQLWVVCSIFNSPLAILWLAFRLSWVHMRCAIKRRSLPKVAQVQKQITAEKAASCLKTSCGAITSIASISYYVYYIYSIVSLHYQQCSVVYTSSLHASTYVKHIYLLLPPRASWKGSFRVKRSRSLLSYSAKIEALIIYVSIWRKLSKLLLLWLILLCRHF